MIIGVIGYIVMLQLYGTKYDKEVHGREEIIIGVSLFIVALCIGYILSVLIGLIIIDIDSLYVDYVEYEKDIQIYTGDEFTADKRNSTEGAFLYKVDTDKGMSIEKAYLSNTYIIEEDREQVKLVRYEYKFKNKLLYLVATDVKNGYNKLYVPNGFELLGA